MNFIKKHKLLFIVLILILILLIVGIAVVGPSLFFSGNKVYGNRLDDIDNYKITDSNVNEITSAIKENTNVIEVEYSKSGKILNFKIKVASTTSIEESKGLTSVILEKISEENKSYYDIQVFLTCDADESDIYPKIGYKHKISTEFVWSNN